MLEAKPFFSAEKNQKTFDTLGHRFGRSNTHAPDKKKSFCFRGRPAFFFRKRRAC